MEVLNVFVTIILGIYFVWVVWFIATMNSNPEYPIPEETTTESQEVHITVSKPRTKQLSLKTKEKWLDLMKNYKMAERVLLKVFRERLKIRRLRLERKLNDILARKLGREVQDIGTSVSSNGTTETSGNVELVTPNVTDFDSVALKGESTTTVSRYTTKTSSFITELNTIYGSGKTSSVDDPFMQSTSNAVEENENQVSHWNTNTSSTFPVENGWTVHSNYSEIDGITVITTLKELHNFTTLKPALALVIDYRWFNSIEMNSLSIPPVNETMKEINQSELNRLEEENKKEPNSVFPRTLNKTASTVTIRLLDNYLTLFVWVLIGWAFLGVTLLLIAVLAFARVKETLRFSSIKRQIVSSDTFRRLTRASNFFDKSRNTPSMAWSLESATTPFTHIHLRSPGSSCSSLVSLRSIMNEWGQESDFSDE